jgi:hypothetical protein
MAPSTVHFVDSDRKRLNHTGGTFAVTTATGPLMKLSPSTWSVLDLLRLRFGVELFVFDAGLEPIVETGIAPGAAEALMDEPGMRERCRAVLATDDSRSPRTTSRAVRTVPLLVGREAQGVLVVTSAERHLRELRDDEIVTLDAAAQIGSAVIEQDLARSRELARERETSRRFEGVLRFLRVLTQFGAEAELMRGVVQAATLWFDLDCRIYVRTTPDAFSLFAALPGYGARDLPARLNVDRVREFARETSVSAPSDLEELGWHVARGSALVLPFGGDPEWVLVAGDVVTPDVELTFDAVTHVLGCALVQGAVARDTRWRERLTVVAPHGFDRALRDLLRQLSIDLGGQSARLSVADAAGSRTLAFAGDASVAAGATTHGLEFGKRRMMLEVGHGAGGPTFEQVATLRSWIRVVEPWLLGASGVEAPAAESEADVFERRIQDEVERAKRSNAGLGGVLIRAERAGKAGAQEPLLRALRAASRASDLTGRVRDGMLAIVLIHAKAEGADSVVARLRRRLKAAGAQAGVRIGHAMFSPDVASADALIRAALGEMDLA